MKKKLHIKTNDTVIVISGDDKGKKGKVVQASPDEGKVIVEGVNVVSKHVKPRRQGEAGGIVSANAPIYASKVQLYCDKCGKATRAAHKIGTDKDGKKTKTRVCVKCGAEL